MVACGGTEEFDAVSTEALLGQVGPQSSGNTSERNTGPTLLEPGVGQGSAAELDLDGGSINFDRLEVPEDPVAFLAWANAQENAFWNNNELDVLPFLEDKTIDLTSYAKDEPDEFTSSEVITLAENCDPAVEFCMPVTCEGEPTLVINSTMYIQQFDQDAAFLDFSRDKHTFPMSWASSPRLAFQELNSSTNELGDTGNPEEPRNPKQRRFRTAADLEVKPKIENGEFIGATYTFGVRGGPEKAPLGIVVWGTAKGLVNEFTVEKHKITVKYVVYGRPNALAEHLFSTASSSIRTSKWIWQEVLVEITPKGCNEADGVGTFISTSLFPSDDVYVDGQLTDHEDQNNFTDLWMPLCHSHSSGFKGAEQYVGSAGVCQTGNLPSLPEAPETDSTTASSE